MRATVTGSEARAGTPATSPGGPLPPLASGTCHVLWAHPDAAHPALVDLLDDPERSRLHALRRPADRARFLVGAALVRLAAAAAMEMPPASVPIDRSCARCGKPHGPPRLAAAAGDDRPLAFSVSHAGDWVVVAVAAGVAIGVDVEPLRPWPDVAHVATDVLAAEERQALTHLAPEERAAAFAVTWTRKEACAKAAGVGLAAPLAELIVSPPGEPPRLLAFPGRPDLPAATALRTLDAGSGYAACLAVVGPALAVAEIDASPLLRDWRGASE